MGHHISIILTIVHISMRLGIEEITQKTDDGGAYGIRMRSVVVNKEQNVKGSCRRKEGGGMGDIGRMDGKRIIVHSTQSNGFQEGIEDYGQYIHLSF